MIKFDYNTVSKAESELFPGLKQAVTWTRSTNKDTGEPNGQES